MSPESTPGSAALLTVCGDCAEGECSHTDCPAFCQCDLACLGCGAVRPQECTDE